MSNNDVAGAMHIVDSWITLLNQTPEDVLYFVNICYLTNPTFKSNHEFEEKIFYGRFFSSVSINFHSYYPKKEIFPPTNFPDHYSFLI